MLVDNIEAVLFDLGGVLVEHGGISVLNKWVEVPITAEEQWSRWLASPTVRSFEKGQISAEQFGVDLVEEFDLDVDPVHFLVEFEDWAVGIYPGTYELLDDLSTCCQLAMLSNTNALHWKRICDQMDLIHRFNRSFPSFKTGRLKPDSETFTWVAESMEFPPEKIMFLDDNQINIDGARSIGMQASRTQGPKEARAVFVDQGLLAY